MPSHSKLLKDAAALSLGQLLSFGLSFIRNIIIIRILTKSDYGFAATIQLAVTLFDLATKMAVNTLVIQDKEGDGEVFQRTAQGFKCVVGLAAGLLLFAMAGPLARIIDVPADMVGEAKRAFQMLAIIPFLRGVENLDVARYVRDLRYLPGISCEVLPQLVTTLVAWPVAVWLGDYRAMLYLIMLRVLLSIALTHVLAERAYRFSWDRAVLRRILSFGWPLFINGFLLFLVMQGDRFVVVSNFSLEEMGMYSVAAQLSMLPGMMVVQVIASIMMPLLSRVQDEGEEFARRYRLGLQMLAMVGAAFAGALILAGEPFCVLAAGQKYAGTGLLIGWLAAGQALRIVRIGPVIGASARGDTLNRLYSNIVRTSGLGLALVLALNGMPLWKIAAAGFVGEFLALIVAMWLFSRSHGVPFRTGIAPAALSCSLIAAAGVTVHYVPADRLVLLFFLGAGFALLSVGATLLCFGEFRRNADLFIGPLRKKLGVGAAAGKNDKGQD